MAKLYAIIQKIFLQEIYCALITVIITTCKREPEILKRAIDSVRSQTFTDWELLIIDDSPEDYSLRDDVRNMVLGLDGNISYFRHDRNYGANHARNTGLKLAKGEYISYLDDDDEFLPEKLEKQLEKFTDSNISMVYCGRIMIDDDKGTEHTAKCIFIDGYIHDVLMRENFVGSCSFPLIRKRVLEEAGGFDENMQSCQDWDMWLNITKNYDAVCVRTPLVKYHVHSSERITGNISRRIQGLEGIYRKHPTKNKYIQCKRLSALSGMYRHNGEYMKSFTCWLKALPLQIFRLLAHMKGEN